MSTHPAARRLPLRLPLRLRFAPALLALVAAVAPATPGGAERGDDDAERARRAVEARRFVPLASILDWIEARYRGHAIEIELEEDDDEPPTYEVEWMTPAGHVVELEFDARDGTLLETEGRGLEDARR
ncbi:MAG: hypothetical protein DCC71_18220 [Proteobacteria bacterium]|nr:MAG: hypothetical protein DCC71_18220 [Pseudomonadota bacterium]